MSDLFLFGLREALLYCVCFPYSHAWILHLGLLARAKQICSAFLTLFAFKLMKRVQPQTKILFTVQLCVWTGVRKWCWCTPAMRHRSGTRMDAASPSHPPLRKWVESQHFPPSWHPRQMELAKRLQRSLSRDHGNSVYRKPAKPIREERALPSKEVPEVDSERMIV